MANVAITLPCEEKTGMDQQARKEWRKARSRWSAHKGSTATSSTITCSPLYAAAAHEFVSGPIVVSPIASVKDVGRLGASARRNRSPSTNRMDAIVSLA